MKKYLVTGGAGFIGSAVCRMLMASGSARVVNVDKLTYAANLQSLGTIADRPDYKLVQQDICDKAAMTALISSEKPDVILHLAAESHVDRSITGPGVFLETNVMGTYALLEAARAYWASLPISQQNAFRFVHVSTDEVYGSLGETGLFSETTAYDPSSPYASSKAASDHIAMAWHRTYGLPVIISNCSNNYGPYQFPEKLIPLMILNAHEEQKLPVYGDGLNVRDWLYVDDHAAALGLIADSGRVGQTYNVGGNQERTNLEVVETICQTFDARQPGPAPHKDLISLVTDRPGHDRRYAIDASKIQRELGWKPIETFESGIAKTIDWYLRNPEWWQPLRKSVYSGTRLGLETATEPAL